jgi:hypothetical protein
MMVRAVNAPGPWAVATDREADPAHVLVVCADDATEGDLVTGYRRREDVGLLPGSHPRHHFHTS